MSPRAEEIENNMTSTLATRIAAIQFLALIGLALCCTGCWPMHVKIQEGASGVVLNSQTRQPVVGARVALSEVGNRYYFVPTNSPEYRGHNYKLVSPTLAEVMGHIEPPTKITDEAGYFSIPPRKEWILYMPPMDVFIHVGTLVVQCEGYETAIIPQRGYVSITETITNTDTILLKPISK